MNAQTLFIQKLIFEIKSLKLPHDVLDPMLTALIDGNMNQIKSFKGNPTFDHILGHYSAVINTLEARYKNQSMAMLAADSALISLLQLPEVDPLEAEMKKAPKHIRDAAESVIEKILNSEDCDNIEGIAQKLREAFGGSAIVEVMDLDDDDDEPFDHANEFMSATGVDLTGYRSDFANERDLVRYATINFQLKEAILFMATMIGKAGGHIGNLSTCPKQIDHFHLGGDVNCSYIVDGDKLVRADANNPDGVDIECGLFIQEIESNSTALPC